MEEGIILRSRWRGQGAWGRYRVEGESVEALTQLVPRSHRGAGAHHKHVKRWYVYMRVRCDKETG